MSTQPIPAPKKSFWQKVEGVFSNLFNKAPTVLQRASSSVQALAPLANLVVAYVDPEYTGEAQALEAEIQTSAATAATAISEAHVDPSAGRLAQVSSGLSSLVNNISGLLALAHVKDPKLQALVTAGVQEAQAVLPLLVSAAAPPPAA